jgi:hypothetical protein
MAVLSVTTFDVAPGRMDDLLAAVRQLQAIEARLAVNLLSLRVFEADVAGDRSGRVSLVFEYADLASWGTTLDRERADEEFLALLAADPRGEIATMVDRSLYVEIPF